MIPYVMNEEDAGYRAHGAGEPFSPSKSVHWRDGWKMAEHNSRVFVDLFRARRLSTAAQARTKQENARHQ